MALVTGEAPCPRQQICSPTALLLLRQRLAREPDVPAPHSWAAGNSEAVVPSAEREDWPQNRARGRIWAPLRESDQPQAFSLKIRTAPGRGNANKGPISTQAQAFTPLQTAKLRDLAEREESNAVAKTWSSPFSWEDCCIPCDDDDGEDDSGGGGGDNDGDDTNNKSLLSTYYVLSKYVNLLYSHHNPGS